MANFAALGRSGATGFALKNLLEGGEEMRTHLEEKRAGTIRVPIGRAETAIPRDKIAAISQPTGTGGGAGLEIGGEAGLAKEAFDAKRQEMEEQADNQLMAVEELPMVKGLNQFPSAKNKLMEIARANNWIQDIGGVPTISRRQMKIAQDIIASDLKMHKEINELALNDITQTLGGLKQSLLDPKLKDEDRANIQSQIDMAVKAQNQALNVVNMADKELRREMATQKPKEKPASKTITTSEGIMQWNSKTGRYDIPVGQPPIKTGAKTAPTNLAKLMEERAQLKATGLPDDDPRIQAYDSKISGTDINIQDLTPDEVDVFGALLNLNGRMPNLGRGKQAAKARIAIAKSAARQALRQDPDAPPDMPDKTPSEAALEMLSKQTDTKAIQGSLNFLEKQIGAMGSFVTNIELQVDKVKELSEDLETFDARLLNIPLRALRGRVKGSPLQAKYDMYLTEIESEIGKLATGSSASISELSVGAQERWSKIHDKNLSVKDMVSLLEETGNAARMREGSVQQQLDKTRAKMVTRMPTTPQQPTGGNTIEVKNPNTGEIEVWDLTTEQRIR
jgi:hypothetical protein